SILRDLWLWIPGSRPAAEPRNDWTSFCPNMPRRLKPRRPNAISASLRPFLEISQIWRRLILADRHQHAVAAHEITLSADGDHGIGLDAGALRRARPRIGVARIPLVHGPRPGQCVVDHRDLVMQEVRIGLVEVDALLEDRLVIE